MSSEYSTDDEAPPPPPATDLPTSISTGSSLLASLVKAKPAPLSDASDSSDDDDDDDDGAQVDEEDEDGSHAPSDDDLEEDEMEQLLVKQEAELKQKQEQQGDDDDTVRKEPKTSSTPSTICEVCEEDTSNAKRALVCAQCGVRFHPTCFRQKYAKLIQTNHLKKWFCPDCEPIKKIALTPKGKGKKRGTNQASAESKSTPEKKRASGAAASAASSGPPKSSDEKYARLVDVALKAGKKFNGIVLEKGEEMLTLAHGLKQDVEAHLGIKKDDGHPRGRHDGDDSDDVAMDDDENDDEGGAVDAPSSAAATPSGVLLRKLAAGLSQLESLIYTLQYHAVQTEVELIKDVKFPPNLEQKSLEREAKEMQKAKLKVKTGGGASRLYSSAQIAKLEEWYGKSSRPESSEIQAMYRIINAPAYADAELQPEGIAVKQIRIWFDNRRAKERLDYMRIKMKDVDTSSMDSEAVKKMKAAYIDEAKEVLEARVAKMRETSTGAMDIMEEAEQLIAEPMLQGDTIETSSPASHGVSAASPDQVKKTKAKQRLRMDHVASVRKAVKVAREMGLSEEEIKEERSKAIQAARDRLYVNGKPLGGHPLTKDEVTHLKFQLLKLLEEDAPAESCMDILELLLSVELPAHVLLDTRLDRQLRLVSKAHQENKEVVKLATKLSDHIQAIVTDSPAAAMLAPDDKPLPLVDDVHSGKEDKAGKASRVKFTVDQLLVLEKAFQQNEAPDKDALVKLSAQLSKSSASGEPSHDYKQLRCWFYKRKAAGHPPSALADALAGDSGSKDGGGSFSDVESDKDYDDDGRNDDEKIVVKKEKASKPNGRIFNDKQIGLLNAAYDANMRPESAVMDQLQDQLNEESGDVAITKRQLKTWFSNKRAKDRQDFVKQRVKEAQAAGVDDLDAVKEAADLEYRELNKEVKDEPSENESDGDCDDAVLKRKKGSAGGKQPAKKKIKREK
ncbi:Aste57867_22254 [Aphanomyces stellatus]|uniref:Aste57867_22254 protein n=1 Tax=Aphanomyces stellatus TaxID=120398 RepID=A0A485LLM0_9STRA|nr:hypothetical protein As57867_022184 [Aphanomyces stellatus]VFT98921.1 Aste57867_22254 [Aphanomyces stellatus]